MRGERERHRGVRKLEKRSCISLAPSYLLFTASTVSIKYLWQRRFTSAFICVAADAETCDTWWRRALGGNARDSRRWRPRWSAGWWRSWSTSTSGRAARGWGCAAWRTGACGRTWGSAGGWTEPESWSRTIAAKKRKKDRKKRSACERVHREHTKDPALTITVKPEKWTGGKNVNRKEMKCGIRAF